MPTRAATDVTIRKAKPADLPETGRYGAALAAAHHAWDPERFFVWDDMEAGYAWWLGKELKSKEAVVLVAERAGKIIGYAYGRLEPRDWNALREACGTGIDLFVDERERRSGVGQQLAQALIDALRDMGAPFVVLQVAANNKRAQRFFLGLGCRATMIEMTLPTKKTPPARKRASRSAPGKAKKTSSRARR